MDLLALPLQRPCSCGASLGLLFGIREDPADPLDYALVLEGDWDQMVWWAEHAVETWYAASARALAAFCADRVPPVHDLLDATGTTAVVGTHRPDLHAARNTAAAQEARYAAVMAIALQQDNYRDFHRVLAEAGLLEPLPRRPLPPAPGT